MRPHEERMAAAAADPRPLEELSEAELRVRALDEALFADPGPIGSPIPPAIAEVLRREGRQARPRRARR